MTVPTRVLFSGPYLIHKTLENARWLDSLHWRNVPFMSSTVILTLQSMCGINMLPSHSPQVRNSQEFKDSQELIFNPSEFLKSFGLCKLSSLYTVHRVHVVHWEMGPVTACTNIVSIWGFYQTRFEFSPLSAVSSYGNTCPPSHQAENETFWHETFGDVRKGFGAEFWPHSCFRVAAPHHCPAWRKGVRSSKE